MLALNSYLLWSAVLPLLLIGLGLAAVKDRLPNMSMIFLSAANGLLCDDVPACTIFFSRGLC